MITTFKVHNRRTYSLCILPIKHFFKYKFAHNEHLELGVVSPPLGPSWIPYFFKNEITCSPTCISISKYPDSIAMQVQFGPYLRAYINWISQGRVRRRGRSAKTWRQISRWAGLAWWRKLAGDVPLRTGGTKAKEISKTVQIYFNEKLKGTI